MRAALVLVLALVAPTVAAGHSVTKEYVLGNGTLAGRFFGVDVGGATYPPIAETPTGVIVADDLGGSAPFFVCQDPDADGECGGRDEPGLISCGAADLATSPFPFRADQETVVFIGAAALWCPGEVGTTGTVTLSYG